MSNRKAATDMLRVMIKENGYDAVVTSNGHYSGGEVINIHMTGQPDDVVAKITTYATQFQYGSFDETTGVFAYNNHRDDLPQVKFIKIHNHSEHA